MYLQVCQGTLQENVGLHCRTERWARVLHQPTEAPVFTVTLNHTTPLYSIFYFRSGFLALLASMISAMK